MAAEPQPETLTLTLPAADWQVILSGLFELPGKFGIPVINRLQAALADAQAPKAPPEEPIIVTPLRGSKG